MPNARRAFRARTANGTARTFSGLAGVVRVPSVIVVFLNLLGFPAIVVHS